jgi:rSAM/selenodomain-associated transferase 1
VATLLLFAKEPVPGNVKTRLIPPLEAREAATLAQAFLRDIIISLETIPDAILEIAVPTGDSLAAMERLLGPGRRFVSQGEGDLGERLAATTEAAFERRPGPVAAVGADHPNLPASLVAECLDEARRGRVGWIPTEDGGYACLALPRPLPGLFRDVPWDTPDVARATRRNARSLGFALTDLSPWYDVDTVEDLRRLADDLRDGEQCPHTRRALAGLRVRLGGPTPVPEKE